ncbi:MAG: hypothetical protein AB1782_00305 [Cyanobacteriota bacterium]
MFHKMGVNDISLEKLPQEGRIYNKKKAFLAGVLRIDTKTKSIIAIF